MLRDIFVRSMSVMICDVRVINIFFSVDFVYFEANRVPGFDAFTVDTFKSKCGSVEMNKRTSERNILSRTDFLELRGVERG